MGSRTIMYLSQRSYSTSSFSRRVLCSLQKLQELQGKGFKFPMYSLEPNEETQMADGIVTTVTKPRRCKEHLTTGFVFMNAKTQQPRAFINKCPHALLELDFDDSDFFCEGFIHCKAHAAFFDPDTGICLQGPISSRKALRGLDELHVAIDGENVVLVADQPKERIVTKYDSQELEVYKRKKQRELAEALSKRREVSEVEEMQQRLHEKTMERMKRYEQMDASARKMKK